jgi:hypothetical protein
MAQLVQSAGIDCGKRFLDVAVYPGGEQIRLENEPADHQRVVVWLRAVTDQVEYPEFRKRFRHSSGL